LKPRPPIAAQQVSLLVLVSLFIIVTIFFFFGLPVLEYDVRVGAAAVTAATREHKIVSDDNDAPDEDDEEEEPLLLEEIVAVEAAVENIRGSCAPPLLLLRCWNAAWFLLDDGYQEEEGRLE